MVNIDDLPRWFISYRASASSISHTSLVLTLRSTLGERLHRPRHNPAIFLLQHIPSSPPVQSLPRDQPGNDPALWRSNRFHESRIYHLAGPVNLSYGAVICKLSSSVDPVRSITSVRRVMSKSHSRWRNIQYALTSPMERPLTPIKGDVDGLGTLRLLDAVRTCGRTSLLLSQEYPAEPEQWRNSSSSTKRPRPNSTAKSGSPLRTN